MSTNTNDGMLPHWAIGTTSDPMQPGAQLCTRDGRRVGNAVTVGTREAHGYTLAQIVTDAGTRLNFTEGELSELFHQPMWLMDPASHPGVKIGERS